jgi:protoporphyrinogen IX oxidase
MLYIKALHIIFMVTWFAGLFYIVRLFVYNAEALEKPEPEKSILVKQFHLMQKRLWYGITWPGMILTWIFGWWLVYENPYFLNAGWFHIKLSFVLALTVYHFTCHRIFKKFQKGEGPYSSFSMRLWNEVATLFLVAIVFIVELQNTLSWIWGVIGLVLFAALLMIGIKGYKKWREKG